jgi:hypothetical protein
MLPHQISYRKAFAAVIANATLDLVEPSLHLRCSIINSTLQSLTVFLEVRHTELFPAHVKDRTTTRILTQEGTAEDNSHP